MVASLRIATRKSRLALWQAETIKSQLLAFYPELSITLIPIHTTGDKWIERPLNAVGGKGLFVKELEETLLSGQAEMAVHSLKDVPAELPKDLVLAAFCERESPEDAFLSLHHPSLNSLPEGAKIGTSSLRRQCQLLAIRPDLNIKALRGNIDTRIRKLESGEWDAIILAYAGIKRLELTKYVKEILPVSVLLPAVGQGTLALECRQQDIKTQKFLKSLHHPQTSLCVRAERAMNLALSGSCQVPIGGLATVTQHHLTLEGLVGDPSGRNLLKAKAFGSKDAPEALGIQVAKRLLTKGANEIIQRCLSRTVQN